jgi:ATP-dependent Zn protease
MKFIKNLLIRKYVHFSFRNPRKFLQNFKQNENARNACESAAAILAGSLIGFGAYEYNKKSSLLINSHTETLNSENELNLKDSLINFKEFLNLIDTNKIDSIIINRNIFYYENMFQVKLREPIKINGKMYETLNLENEFNMKDFEYDLIEYQKPLHRLDESEIKFIYNNTDKQNFILNALLSTVFCLVVFKIGMKNVMNSSVSNLPRFKKIDNKKIKTKRPKITMIIEDQIKTVQYEKSLITFDSVAGLHQAKTEIKEFIDLFNYPNQFHNLGNKIPNKIKFNLVYF